MAAHGPANPRSANTIEINKGRTRFEDRDRIWLFGYGSLLFKADFPYLERRPARIRGWVRRFWQGSHDHRGTERAPGRVVTLIPQPGAVCAGMAYLITPERLDELDIREKNGYLRFSTELSFVDTPARSRETAQTSAEGLVYIATEDNPAFMGHASEEDIAREIARSHGPSGANRDYVTALAAALRALGEHDPHVFAIERRL